VRGTDAASSRMRPEGVIALAIDCSLLAANSPTNGALVESLVRQRSLWFCGGLLSHSSNVNSGSARS
jgi:hypothetical protein